MAIDKIKLKAQFQRNWKKYYNLSFFKAEGFTRKKCKKCGVSFWTQVKDKDVCNESACLGGYTFIGKSPAKRKLDYQETWKEFSRIMGGLGYTEIPRYPVIARWRDDTWFTQASIYCFQPHVVSGEVAPPANPLTIPQPSLRFNDIDNVGVTGAHYTTHIHMGQHAFMPPHKFKPSEYLKDIYVWLTKGLKIPSKELTFHEDVWAGGGNLGPSIEYFCRGMELGNQVYMMFKDTPAGPKPLQLNVLDHGGGLERQAWITHGTPTSYEIVFDPVDDKYRKKIKLKYDKKLLKEFATYAGLLTTEKDWRTVAKKLGLDVKGLRAAILPVQAFYSVLDHTRTILFALADGALPSNSGGGYNLRFILRRALGLIEKFGWDISLSDVARDHVRAFTGEKPRRVVGLRNQELIEVGLSPMFNKLLNKLPDVERILSFEEQKYRATKQNVLATLNTFLKKEKEVSVQDLIKLYDTQGIPPELVQTEAAKQKIKVDIPINFYSRIGEQHTEKVREKPKVFIKDLKGIPPTYSLYLEAEKIREFDARVLKIVDNRYVVLDETVFYPTSGGQLHDIGTINMRPVVNVEKWGPYIVHEVENIDFKKGSFVTGKIEWDRRWEITRHHTATHIVNGVARRVLGDHIWQAGSEVTPEKARLDITHFASLTPEELRRIEWLANDVVLSDLPINKFVMPKDEAEKIYGFRIYQGGAVPGAELRIIETPGFDIEACGGTHVDRTGEVGFIKILGTKKIQDGVIRLEFVSGKRGIEEVQKAMQHLTDASEVFRVPPEHLAKTCKRFFEEWKKFKKELRKTRK